MHGARGSILGAHKHNRTARAQLINLLAARAGAKPPCVGGVAAGQEDR
jgi:hypothetical protein